MAIFKRLQKFPFMSPLNLLTLLANLYCLSARLACWAPTVFSNTFASLYSRHILSFIHNIFFQMLSDQSNSQELKGKFFISELDVPPLGESNLMGPKKSHPTKVSHTKHETLIFMFFLWRTFAGRKNYCYIQEPLLCLENIQDMMKSDSWSYMVVRWDWTIEKGY